jgi:hypothetical protein
VPHLPKDYRHPYADARYQVFRLDDGTFGIKFTAPDIPPVQITNFSSRKAANQWIEKHKKTVEGQTTPLSYVKRWPPPPLVELESG